jgi:hypothetical protein
VSRRFDLLRSLVRAGAEGAGQGLRRLTGADSLRRALEDVRNKRAVLGDDALTAALAHAPGVQAASATVRQDALELDASFRDGSHVQFRLVPLGARFAPRGAKEVLFRVEPQELARDRRVSDLVSAVAGALAHAVWVALLPHPGSDVSGAIVERDGEDSLRVDLRTVPSVRRMSTRGPRGTLFEAIEVKGLHAEPGRLGIEIRLPELGI